MAGFNVKPQVTPKLIFETIPHGMAELAFAGEMHGRAGECGGGTPLLFDRLTSPGSLGGPLNQQASLVVCAFVCLICVNCFASFAFCCCGDYKQQSFSARAP